MDRLEPECEPGGGMEPESDPAGRVELGSDRVVSDLIKVCKDNQHRMGVDPFEVMLMRMGFRLQAMTEEGVQQPTVEQREGEGPGGGRGEAMDEDEGDMRWVNHPSNCRQS